LFKSKIEDYGYLAMYGCHFILFITSLLRLKSFSICLKVLRRGYKRSRNEKIAFLNIKKSFLLFKAKRAKKIHANKYSFKS